MALKSSSGIVSKGLAALYDASNARNFTLNEIEVLVVGGGGGGGANHAGGGGAGGVVYNNRFIVTPGQSIVATVGFAGTAASSPNGNPTGPIAGSGGPSVFGNITALGGGGGGNRNDTGSGNPGQPGASGGGGGGAQTTYSGNYPAGSGTPGQGNPGGTAVDLYGGGGGGAGATGRDGYSSGNNQSGNGGIGRAFSISGTLKYYGGGGGSGYGGNVNGGLGGYGGGGSGGVPVGDSGRSGAPNTGGGGGGGGAGGQGGSPGGTGIIITRYPGPQKATGGNTIEYINGYTVHTFTSSGTFIVNAAAAPASGATVNGYQNLVSENASALRVGSPTWTTSNNGSAVFNGSGDRLVAGPLPGDFTEFSVLVFFYPTSVVNYRNVIDCNFQFNTQTGNVGPRLEMNSSGGIAWIISGSINDNNTYSAVAVLGSGLSANNWHFSAITRNAGHKMSTYYNGAIVGNEVDAPAGFVDKFTNVAIGRGFHPSSDAERSFAGRIPLVMIYNRALTSAEISQNYNFYRGRFGL